MSKVGHLFRLAQQFAICYTFFAKGHLGCVENIRMARRNYSKARMTSGVY